MTEPQPRLEDFLTYRVTLLAQLIGRDAARLAARHGLRLPEYRLLWHLVTEGPCSPTAIVARHAMDKGLVSRALDGLIARGLAAQVPDPTDGRRLLAEATPAGRALHAALLPDALSRQGALRGVLSTQELAMLEQALDRLIAHMRVA
jgi:DNA-binding MarR family transcriptional regulator